MYRVMCCAALLLTAGQALAQTCQNVNIVSQGMEERQVPSDWHFVDFASYNVESVGPPPGPSGVHCEVDVSLGGGHSGVLGRPQPGFFEGVLQIGRPQRSLQSLTRQLAITPELAPHDELSLYELSLGDNGPRGQQQLVVRMVAGGPTTGTVYVFLATYFPEDPEPQVEVLLEVNFDRQKQAIPCAGLTATACVTTAWSGDAFDSQLKVRLDVSGKSQQTDFSVTNAVPTMRLGYLDALYLSGSPASKVKLRHKVCNVDGAEIPYACNY